LRTALMDLILSFYLGFFLSSNRVKACQFNFAKFVCNILLKNIISLVYKARVRLCRPLPKKGRGRRQAG